MSPLRLSARLDKQPSRVLEFPTRTTAGNLYVRHGAGGWRFLCPARGRVEVPRHHEVRLELTSEMQWGSRPFFRLPVRGIKQLVARALPVGPKDLLALTQWEDLETLSLPHCPVGDNSMQALARIASLRVLDLTGTFVTAQGLKHLTCLESLRSLVVNLCPIDDEAGAPLSQLARLESLHFGGTLLGDEGFAQLTALRNLREIEFSASATRESFYRLQEFPDLRALLLNRANPDDEALGSLHALPRLEMLSLPEQLHNESMRRLLNVRGLRFVWIESEEITAHGLYGLHGSPNIETLVSFSGLTPEEVTALLFFTRLKRLYLPLAEVTLETLRSLQQLWWLKELRIHCPDLTDADVPLFDGFLHLDSLHLLSSQLTASGFELLREKLSHARVNHEPPPLLRRIPSWTSTERRLTRTQFFARPISQPTTAAWYRMDVLGDLSRLPKDHELAVRCQDRSLAALGSISMSALHHVTELRLDGTEVGAEAVWQVGRMGRLSTFHARECSIHPQIVGVLAHAPSLRWLTLNVCGISDVEAEILSASESLQEIELRDNPLGDNGLAALAALGSLRKLDVTRTQVSAEGVKRFQEKRPDVTLLYFIAPVNAADR